jgi:hypothetical protein
MLPRSGRSEFLGSPTTPGRAARLVALAGALALAALPVWGKEPLGTPFQVNSSNYYYPGFPHGPDIAMSSDGDFVVVWDARYAYESVRGQLFDSTGGAIGGEFAATMLPPSYYVYGRQSAVDMDASGRFVVVWRGSTYDEYGILARRFDDSGTPLGDPVVANTTNDYDPRNPKVAIDDSGGFVVVWGQYSTDGSLDGQLFSAAGTPVGGEFEVAPPGSHGFSYYEDDDGIEIDARPTGEFVVAWRGYDEDDNQAQILVRSFDASATPLGPVFEVNTDVSAGSDRYSPGVSTDPLGNFVVVWQGDNAGTRGVWARRFDSAGVPLGLEFQVNPGGGDYPQYPKVASDPSGAFVVTWHEYEDGYSDVHVRRFDASGAPLDSEFVLEGADTSYDFSDVATDPDGNFVVAWNREYPRTIQAQRFGDPPGHACAPAPLTGCKDVTKLKASSLRLIESVNPTGRKLGWKWLGDETLAADLGDPLADDGTDYAFCVYDGSGAAQPVFQGLAEAGGLCGLAACWKVLGGAGPPVEYRHPATNADGLYRIRLKPGEDGKARIGVQGLKQNLELPALPLTLTVTAQLQNSDGVCWTASYDMFVSKNDDKKFIARSGSLP